jgi:hypothetical protein
LRARIGLACAGGALDVASGSVIAQHYRRHRHQEFLRFLKLIDGAVPSGLDLHLICDNYATHKTAEVQKRLLQTQALRVDEDRRRDPRLPGRLLPTN